MNTDTEHSDKIVKFSLSTSIYDKLYKAKIENKYVEITLYHKDLDEFGYDYIYLNDGMIYTLNKFKSVKLILSPQQLCDLKYRITYENKSHYTIDYSDITLDINRLESILRSKEKVSGYKMNDISHIHQKLGDILMEIRNQKSTEV